jgi:hypothetical protein
MSTAPRSASGAGRTCGADETWKPAALQRRREWSFSRGWPTSAFDYWSRELDEMKVQARALALQAARIKSDLLLGARFDAPPPVINVQEATKVHYPQSLYHSFVNAYDEELTGRWFRDMQFIRAHRPRNTYYLGLYSGGDIQARERPMQPECVQGLPIVRNNRPQSIDMRSFFSRQSDDRQMTRNRKRARMLLPFRLLAGFAVLVCVVLLVYRPDRPIAPIVPGSSAGPNFVVQIVRPRLGLPLAGILPPRLFGLDAQLGFDATSPGATVRHVSPQRLDLAADDWELRLVLNDEGRVSAETQVVFSFVFEERLGKVRCRPGQPAVGKVKMVTRASAELSGSFDIELAHCEDADTGTSLDWPPQPFVLHGSFDRLPLDNATRKH